MNDQEDWYWYHFIISTYGSWLHGDARGFRTRHHREHIEGDYKNPPPPGMYESRERRSRKSLKHAPVVLTPSLRPIVGGALKERLQTLGALVVCISMSGQHAHGLTKMPRALVRDWGGLAKKHAWFVARELGWKEKLWGKRGKAIHVKTREHQLNVYRYILAHAKEGAWVWSMLFEKKKD
jgi:hypothetical protein